MANAGANRLPPSPLPDAPSTTGSRRRRDSLTSASASSHVDKDQLALALDKIHTSASQSAVLTTFNDFASPPGAAPVAENKGTAGEIVQQGLSGLYSRFKEVVGVVGKTTTQGADDVESQDGVPKKSPNPTAPASKDSAPTLQRGESGGLNDSALSSDVQTSGLSSSGAVTAASQSQPLPSSKASSITTMSTTKTGVQNITHTPKASISSAGPVSPTIASLTASGLIDNELARGTSSRGEEVRARSTGRRSISKPGDAPSTLNLSGNASLESVATGDRSSARSRRDDVLSVDSNTDTPLSPLRLAPLQSSSTSSRLASADAMRRPAVIDRISHTRGDNRSRSSSMEPRTAEPSPISTSAHSSIYHDSFSINERPQRLQSGAMKIPGTTTNEGAPEMVNARLEMMRKQVLSKEFWMADETCKECFLCGTPFTAFRRKHHCRTCGCIFDSKCTSNIPGQKFGVQGTLRVCKTCLDVINRRYDSGSDDSGDEPYLHAAIFRSNQSKAQVASSKPRADDEMSVSERAEQVEESRSATTPMMAIPATRRVGDNNRNSSILEIDTAQLSRPGSSRSLKSLSSSRPQSSGHRRHHSKHNFLTRFKATAEDRAPFRKTVNEELGKKSKLNAFHDDNIIDPELAAYMSDESSGDEQMSIFATMNSNDIQPSSLDPDRSSFGPYLSAGKKHRFRHGEKSISGLSHTSRGHEDSIGLANLAIHTRPTRRRNLSTASASVHHLRSPRPRSGIFGGPSVEALPGSGFPGGPGLESSSLQRAESFRDGKMSEGALNPTSLQHVKRLFRQLLSDADIPNPSAWEKALIPILDRCADDVDPDIRNGDDMDIRHWVKLKKIPGGKPSDTAYVHGVVYSKKLALKSMPRKIANPRIVVITFPIEYQRHSEQHFMSLQPVIEQEKEYLRMVVNRILNLEPQVLLLEKSVSGVALQYLSEANVTVVYNVKPTVIEAVSRIVNMPIISSMDMLSLGGARVGMSQNFEVKTYVNNEFPGRKKTYIFISGCPKDRGCTIALRGAPTQVLAKMKKITEFMVYVVYNLKLESCLMRDEFVYIPPDLELPAPSASTQQSDDRPCQSLEAGPGRQNNNPTVIVTSQSTESSDQVSQSNGNEATETEPQPVDQNPELIAEQTKKLVALHETHSTNSQDTPVPEDVPMPTFYSDMVAKYETRILSASPFVRFTQPYLLMKAREQERRLVYLKRLRDQDIVEDQGESEESRPQRFELIRPEMVHELGQKAPRQIMDVLHAIHDTEYDRALFNYQTQTKQWETTIQGSLDLFDPYSHQNIVVLYSVTCTATKIPCVEPSLIAIEFYNEHADPAGNLDQDFTLGQFIEDVCEGAESICHQNGCDRKMFEHHRTYVHDNARVTVIVENFPVWPENFGEKPLETESEKDGTGICMWNYCKLCNKHFGLMPMSISTWKYSFGKYLELSFWSKGLHLNRLAGCPHDHQKDHVRYFYYQYRDIAVKVHYDPIDLYEIIVPRARVTWKVENDLRLKNEVFLKDEDRWTRYITSVKARLRSIRIDSVLPEKADACKAEVERLIKKAQEDQLKLVRNLQEAYMNSKYYEVIPLNAVVREMLEKVSEWDAAFAKFEADFLSDKDVRQLTILQLKKMFTDNESKESLPSSDGTTLVGSEADDKSTPQTSQSQASEAEERPSQSSHGASNTVPPTPSSTTGEPIPLSKEPSVTQEVAAAQEADAILERVEPLDLATPKSPTLIKGPLMFPEPSAESSKVSNEPSTETTPTPPPPSSIPRPVDPVSGAPHMTLTEKVEQLRREQRTVSTDAGSSLPAVETVAEPARQISDRTLSRRAGSNISPPIVRAVTQPTGTLTRTQSALGKLLKEQKTQEPGESQRAPSDGPAKGEKKFTDRIGLGSLKNRKGGASGIPRYVHNKRESKVSTLARHFEQLSAEFTREFQKERIKDRKQRAAKMPHTRAFVPRTSTKAIVEVYEDVDEAVQEPGPSDEDHVPDKEQDGTRTADASQDTGAAPALTLAPEEPMVDGPEANGPSPASQPEEAHTPEAEAGESRRESRAGSDDEGAGSDADHSTYTLDEILPDVKEIADSLEPSDEIPEELPRHQTKSLMAMLSNFWAERSASGWTPLDYPAPASDHVFIDSDVFVREDEPSSLIAFALSSEDYKLKLADIRRHGRLSQTESEDSGDGLEMKTTQGVSSAEQKLEKSLLRTTSTHLKYQFTEGSAKMMCKIFYAEQFDALRRKCGVADRIIESLSRCLKWDSKGGKTKSVFLKTLDDRLVMKSLSPIETSAFLKFAPSYFSIMAEALFHDLPSVIAKMLGFFQVVIKNPLTNTDIKLDLLVMENLFYDRTPSRTFDLKGSMRNRKIQSTGEQNEVLLDENMVEYIYESPLFAREHSKRILRASVWNDTLFLARQQVMDYSLMIAVDEARKELVVGIIDCIRTYTWDKRVESWIKDRGFAGGGRNKPTVTSPKEYKSRFREAMARYILQSPNCWHLLGHNTTGARIPGAPRTRFEGDV